MRGPSPIPFRENMMKNPEQVLKQQAKRLRDALNEEGIDLGHRKTLELMSRVHG